MTKRRMKIGELKVKSFVLPIQGQASQTVRGGSCVSGCMGGNSGDISYPPQVCLA